MFSPNENPRPCADEYPTSGNHAPRRRLSHLRPAGSNFRRLFGTPRNARPACKSSLTGVKPIGSAGLRLSGHRPLMVPNGGFGVDGFGLAAMVSAGKAQLSNIDALFDAWTRKNQTGPAIVPSQVEVRCVLPQTE